MIDTHAHINSKVLKNLKEEIIKINNSALNKVINIGCDYDTNIESLAIAGNYSKFYVSLGVHPLMNGNIEDILSIFMYSDNSKYVVAIGETGLDNLGNLDTQKKKFIESIELANFLHLPIIIHANNTNKLVLDILKMHPPHYGFVFHCFQPNLDDAREIVKRDGFISVGTPITRPTAKKSLEVVKNIPLDNLLIETDYPYMSEFPRIDGKLIFKKIQELKELDFIELEQALDANAKRLFYKLKWPNIRLKSLTFTYN